MPRPGAGPCSACKVPTEYVDMIRYTKPNGRKGWLCKLCAHRRTMLHLKAGP